MRKNHPYPARPFLIKHQASFVQELKYVSAVFQHYIGNLGENMFLADLQDKQCISHNKLYWSDPPDRKIKQSSF